MNLMVLVLVIMVLVIALVILIIVKDGYLACNLVMVELAVPLLAMGVQTFARANNLEILRHYPREYDKNIFHEH